MAPARPSISSSAVSSRHEQQAQRRAALAGRAEGRERSRRRSPARAGRWCRRTCAFSPPVSAMKGTIGPSRAARARLIAQAVSVPPVKATPSQPGWAISACADASRRRPGSRRQQARIEPGGVEQAHRLGGDQRGLLGRLGQHRVAGGQRRGDLAGEDRQREVPRADADEDAAAVQVSALVSPTGPGSVLGRGELALGDGGVVAAEVGRLAHLGDAVGAASCRPRARSRATRRVAASPPARRPWRAAPAARAAPPAASQAGLGRARRRRRRASMSAGGASASADGAAGERRGRSQRRRRSAGGQRRVSASRGDADASTAWRGRRRRSRAASRGRAGVGMRGCGPARRSHRRDRVARPPSRPARRSSSRAWTKEVLAPFSSSRRTR